MDRLRFQQVIARKNAQFDPYTVLLAHMDGSAGGTTFVDFARGGNAPHALTANGDAKVINGHLLTANGNAQIDTAQYKIGTSSLLLDGTGDYVTIPDSEDWDIGTDDFAIEAWIRLNTAIVEGPDDDVHRILAFGDVLSQNGACWFGAGNWGSGLGNATRIGFSVRSGGAITDYLTDALTLNVNTWYHVAVTRSGTTLRIFLDGVSQTIGVGGSTCSSSLGGISALIYVGARPGIAEYWDGWVDELRLSNGIARYTSGFTPSTSAFTTDTYTKLLCHFEGADAATAMYDDSTSSGIVKFSQVLALDGTGDYLSIPDSADWNFADGDFTIEFWLRCSTVQNMLWWNQEVDADNYFQLYWDATNKIIFASRASASYLTDFYVTWTPSANTWYHIALVRNGSNWYLFINGVSQSKTLSNGSYSATQPDIAANIRFGSNASGYHVAGTMDELRVSKGVARYVANFTPPTVPFTANMRIGDWRLVSDDSPAAYIDEAEEPLGAAAWLCLSSVLVPCYRDGYIYGVTADNPDFLDQCGTPAVVPANLLGWPASDDFALGAGCGSAAVDDTNWAIRWLKDVSGAATVAITGESLSVQIAGQGSAVGDNVSNNVDLSGVGAWTATGNFADLVLTKSAGNPSVGFRCVFTDGDQIQIYRNKQDNDADPRLRVNSTWGELYNESNGTTSGSFALEWDGINQMKLYFGGVLKHTEGSIAKTPSYIMLHAYTGNGDAGEVVQLLWTSINIVDGSSNPIYIDPAGVAC